MTSDEISEQVTIAISRDQRAVFEQIIPRSSHGDTVCALLNLAWTQSRLAHRMKREALAWEAKGNRANFADLQLKSRRLWRDAKAHLQLARNWSGK